MTILDFFPIAGVLVGNREFNFAITISLDVMLEMESIEDLLAGVPLPCYPIITTGRRPPESSTKLLA